jgi:hypothetical protein
MSILEAIVRDARPTAAAANYGAIPTATIAWLVKRR